MNARVPPLLRVPHACRSALLDGQRRQLRHRKGCATACATIWRLLKFFERELALLRIEVLDSLALRGSCHVAPRLLPSNSGKYVSSINSATVTPIHPAVQPASAEYRTRSYRI